MQNHVTPQNERPPLKLTSVVLIASPDDCVPTQGLRPIPLLGSIPSQSLLLPSPTVSASSRRLTTRRLFKVLLRLSDAATRTAGIAIKDRLKV